MVKIRATKKVSVRDGNLYVEVNGKDELVNL